VAPAFIEECLAAVPWAEYDVVGFCSIFEQNCAALALARRLKERYPHLVTVFGGANFEDEMGLEYVRALPWVDYAVIGEGDDAFPALLTRLARGEEVLHLPGVARRDATGGVLFEGRQELVRDLDVLPTPDYTDYFVEAEALGHPGVQGAEPVFIMYESARGCWWGQKHHCTFCGLNGMGMAYRSKSPARVLDELDDLARRHAVYSFTAVDNILDHRYFREVFGPLAEGRTDYQFFWAVKANLSAEQIRKLARAGVRRLQPGIESLSTHVLALMNKGTTSLQNIRFLKWCAYYGISVAWNILMGFPGETEQDYADQIALMRLIPHLEPPETATRILLERFSPNFTRAAEFGFTEVRADRAYACIYPATLDHERIAYFFDYSAPAALPDAVHAPVKAEVQRWKAAWHGPRRPSLTYLRGAGRLTLLDGRDPSQPRVQVVNEPAALVYEACGPTSHNTAQVAEYLRTHGYPDEAEAVPALLDNFVRHGFMAEEGGSYLSLALPANPNW
jgi:ribosomal peptide maturation radical SAM protein 1